MFYVFIFGQIITHTENGHFLMSNIPQIESGIGQSRTRTCDTYDDIIRHWCQLYGVDHVLVKIIIEKESEFNPRAVSRSGAIGLMQLMPETIKHLGVKNPYNPRDNIMGGVKYLRNLFDMFGGNLELALAAYHAGPNMVKRLNRVPAIPETIEYVDYITSRYGSARRENSIHFSLTEDGIPFFTNRPK